MHARNQTYRKEKKHRHSNKLFVVRFLKCVFFRTIAEKKSRATDISASEKNGLPQNRTHRLR